MVPDLHLQLILFFFSFFQYSITQPRRAAAGPRSPTTPPRDQLPGSMGGGAVPAGLGMVAAKPRIRCVVVVVVVQQNGSTGITSYCLVEARGFALPCKLKPCGRWSRCHGFVLCHARKLSNLRQRGCLFGRSPSSSPTITLNFHKLAVILACV